MNQDREKQIAAEAAADLVQDGMVVGLGTGSTALFALRKLGQRVREGLKMEGVPSSNWAAETASKEGIPLVGFDKVTRLDLALDGADEFDPGLNMIKGGGGALFREKIVAASADKLVIFTDASKQVKTLGAFPLPVEVNPFGWQVVARKITELGANVALRGGEKAPFVSDNQGYILDCAFGAIADPPGLEAALKDIVGVMETGLFVGLAHTVFLADGEKLITLSR